MTKRSTNRDDGGATFNIGTQHHSVNVGRDQYVSGGQYVGAGGGSTADDLNQLRELLDTLRLSGDERRQAAQAIDETEAALQAPQPQPEVAASALERFTILLKNAGAIATAGAVLIDPLTRIATGLGGLGGGVLRLLGH